MGTKTQPTNSDAVVTSDMVAHRANFLPNGKFAPGNKMGRGNPNNMKAQQLRNTMLEVVTHEDMEAITKKLIHMARNGNLYAMRELYDRVLGKAKEHIELTAPELTNVDQMSEEDLLRIVMNKDNPTQPD